MSEDTLELYVKQHITAQPEMRLRPMVTCSNVIILSTQNINWAISTNRQSASSIIVRKR